MIVAVLVMSPPAFIVVVVAWAALVAVDERIYKCRSRQREGRP